MGLDPVRNLSKRAFKPDYDDQGSLESAESVKVTNVTKSYKCMQPKSNQNQNRIKIKSSQIQSKSSQIQIKSNPNQIQIQIKSKSNQIQIKIKSKSEFHKILGLEKS